MDGFTLEKCQALPIELVDNILAPSKRKERPDLLREDVAFVSGVAWVLWEMDVYTHEPVIAADEFLNCNKGLARGQTLEKCENDAYARLIKALEQVDCSQFGDE